MAYNASYHRTAIDIDSARNLTRGLSHRAIHLIAKDIQKYWADAPRGIIDHMNNMYRADNPYAHAVIASFLNKSAAWDGPNSDRIKTELNQIIR